MVNYISLTAWAAVLTAFVAALALWVQLRSSRFVQGIDLLLRLDDRFNSGDMLVARQRAAKGFLEGTDVYVDPILDFFEMLGMLVRKRAIDDQMVWHSFFFWFNSYWHLATARIAMKRTADHTVWAEAAYLYRRLVILEREQRSCSEDATVPSNDTLSMFLTAEATLGV